jgi:TnpA family transposase
MVQMFSRTFGPIHRVSWHRHSRHTAGFDVHPRWPPGTADQPPPCRSDGRHRGHERHCLWPVLVAGYQFSPRLADIGEARFWRLDPTADYGLLNSIARHRIKTDLIVRHWDDLLRVAGSLHLGTVSASELLRSLLRSKRPSTLARAIGTLGRISKTLYLLAYIDDEHYCRRILSQLNRGEGRHSVARAVFHGQRGELRQRYREGQEDQLGALGLVVNVIILWNTLYMEAALQHLRAEGVAVQAMDVARLSPLGHHHINFQ